MTTTHSYYDAVLLAIPLVSGIISGGLVIITDVYTPVAVLIGGTAALLLISHAMFLRAPIPTSPAAAANSVPDTPSRSLSSTGDTAPTATPND